MTTTMLMICNTTYIFLHMEAELRLKVNRAAPAPFVLTEFDINDMW